MKKPRNINNKLIFIVPLIVILTVWQLICTLEIVPTYMLPSPISVVMALITEFPTLLLSSVTTLWESFVGLVLAVLSGLVLAIIMDNSIVIESALSPLLLITQTVPSVAVAPLLILWFGYGLLPKVILVYLTCFFPITIELLSGLKGADPDAITLLKSMGATKAQIYRHIKLPGAMPEFFSGLRISATYALVAAVVAEWLGGNNGLGVYMTRVRKSYSLDKMFAVIFLISSISLLLVHLINYLEKKVTPWNRGE